MTTTSKDKGKCKEKQQEFMDYLLKICDGKEKIIKLSTDNNMYEEII